MNAERKLKFKTHNEKKINRIGTCLQGYVDISYSKLVQMFGEPQIMEEKVRAIWILQFHDGEIATIYDYKSHVTPENVTDWHIGGNREVVVGRVSRILKTPALTREEHYKKYFA